MCIYNEERNKIAISGNDDKRLQTFDRIKTYPYGKNTFKVCENEILNKYKLLVLMIIQMKTKQNILKQFKVAIYSR